MTTPYFQKPWIPFVYQDVTYPLSHLDEYSFAVADTDGVERRIAVSFSDHCFTRKPLPADDASLFYPDSDRNPGVFCFVRYGHSLHLTNHIAQASKGKVWNAGGYHEGFAIVPVVNQAGEKILYAIIFSLDRAGKDMAVDLHMRIRSAYPCDHKPLATFGEVKFRTLVSLRMKNKRPARSTESQRRKPQIT
jgi:hypothetical protein